MPRPTASPAALADDPDSPHLLFLQTIICQCQEDYQLLSTFTDSDRNPLGKQLKKLNLTCIEPGKPRERPSMSREEVCLVAPAAWSLGRMRMLSCASCVPSAAPPRLPGLCDRLCPRT